ncbi:MAG: mobile mystery protein B [Bacteroidia bacterium]|nr:MAG: mobile mystery protein B [Bacteroidia bacterium]
MGLELEYIKGQTPLEEEEKEELKIKTISTRGELDEFEQANIEKAIEWSLKSNPHHDKILTVDFIKEVHKRMFSEVWGWAGRFRKTNKNIGVDKYQIEVELTKLMDDCKFWIENKSFSEDEIAIRFKHRMVKVHPFPNGNGRHSRLCADILISKGLNKKIFTWGSKNISDQGETRAKYLKAIYEADKENIQPLIEFART